jgi:hypothetical protein
MKSMRPKWGIPAKARGATMKNRIVRSAIAAFTLAVLLPNSANSAIYLNYSGSPPFSISDTDGLGLADIDPAPSGFGFDVVFDDLGGTDFSGGLFPGGIGQIWNFTVSVTDPSEILAGGYVFNPSAAPQLLPLFSPAPTPTSISQTYEVNGVIPSGTILGSFVLSAVALGIAPDDEVSDLLLASGLAVGANVFDPVTGTTVAGNVGVNFDAQTVPIPAAIWLFGTGLLGLIGISRRKKAT